jgi:cellulose synthase operon protein C
MLQFRRTWVWGALGRTALIAALFAAAVPVQAAPDPASKSAFERGQKLRQKRDFRAARIEYLNAIDQDGQWAPPHIALAAVSLDLFDPITARAELDRARALNADAAVYNHLLGQSLWMSGQTDRALDVLTQEPISPRFRPYALRLIGRLRLDRGEIDEAEKALAAAVKLAPSNSMVWAEIGRFRMAIANQGGAIEALDYAVKLDPNNIRALELRGRLVRTQYGLVAALPWFERGLQINSSDVPLLEEYGLTLGEAGRYRDMLVQARKLISLDSNNAKAFYMQATIAARSGNYELARRLMSRVNGAFGELPGPRMLMAIVEYEMGNANQSIDILEQLVDAQPYNLRLRVLLAQAMHKAGDHDEAWEMLAPVADRNDADSYTLLLAARILEALGERDKASPRLQKAAGVGAVFGGILPETSPPAAAADDARRNPRDAKKVIPHVRLLLANNNVAQARSEVAELIQGNGGVADAHILMGDVEMAAGSSGAAIAAYERAKAISFSTPVMIRLVNAYRKSGRVDSARKILSDFLAFNPSSLAALRLVAYDHLDNKRWKDAIPGLLAVRSRLGYNDALLNANIARAYSGNGEHGKAIEEAALAYRIAPANPMVTFVFGETLHAAGKHQTMARSMLKKANKLAPNDPAIKKALAAAGKAPAIKPAPTKAPPPAAKPVEKPVPIPTAKPAPKPAVKPIPKPTPKPVQKPVAKPALKPVAKPAKKPKPKPAPKKRAN